MKNKIRRIAAGFLVAGIATIGFSGIASAHDITNPTGVCVGKTANAADFGFTASNMGSETRHIEVFLNGTQVGSTGNFTGNGPKTVHVTSLVPTQTGNVTFTWTTDANVPQGTPTSIVVDFSNCQPEVTTTTTTTVLVTTTTEKPTTTTTTLPPTTTTIPPFCVPTSGVTCINIDPTTTTVPQSTTTTVAQTTTVPSAPPTEPSTTAAVAPPPSEPTVTPAPELPHTGGDANLAYGGAFMVLVGAGLLIFRKLKFTN